jgi:CDP-diacylglycerol--glycerol-3-phosphate 3-phosphatidyltransferase
VLFAKGQFPAAAGFMALAGLGDLLDGPVARRQNRVSLFGGFLESILDRYADLMLFLGLLVYYVSVNRFLYAVLAGIAMAGAVMVSYAKARAESLVPIGEVGFWERPERLVLMIIGGLADRMALVLWILAIGANVTVIHRIIRTWRQTLDATDTSVANPARPSAVADPSSVPNLLTRTAGRGR